MGRAVPNPRNLAALRGAFVVASTIIEQRDPTLTNALRAIDIAKSALFLDLDGTLADLHDLPSAVSISHPTLAAIDALSETLSGALAIISGRDIDDIDRILAPRRVAVAGVHGARRRDARGVASAGGLSPDVVGEFAAAFRREFDGEGGVLIEVKSAAVALHYRLRPDLQQRCEAFARLCADRHGGVRVLGGKSVFEIVARDGGKGGAIAAFMAEAPFHGRVPIFAGDDVTDESGFAVVNQLGGVSIKVGSGPTGARYRVASGEEFRDLLSALAAAALRRD